MSISIEEDVREEKPKSAAGFAEDQDDPLSSDDKTEVRRGSFVNATLVDNPVSSLLSLVVFEASLWTKEKHPFLDV